MKHIFIFVLMACGAITGAQAQSILTDSYYVNDFNVDNSSGVGDDNATYALGAAGTLSVSNSVLTMTNTSGSAIPGGQGKSAATVTLAQVLDLSKNDGVLTFTCRQTSGNSNFSPRLRSSSAMLQEINGNQGQYKASTTWRTYTVKFNNFSNVSIIQFKEEGGNLPDGESLEFDRIELGFDTRSELTGTSFQTDFNGNTVCDANGMVSLTEVVVLPRNGKLNINIPSQLATYKDFLIMTFTAPIDISSSKKIRIQYEVPDEMTGKPSLQLFDGDGSKITHDISVSNGTYDLIIDMSKDWVEDGTIDGFDWTNVTAFRLTSRGSTLSAGDLNLDYLQIGAIPFVVEASNSGTKTDYEAGLYNDVVILSDNSGTGQLDLEEGSLTVNGRVILQKTVSTGQWYPLGFPFDATVSSTVEEYTNPVANRDYWLYDYDARASQIFGQAEDEGFTANKGYIAAFPSVFNDEEIGFTSSGALTLQDKALEVSETSDDYRLVANGSFKKITLTQGYDNKYYYKYNVSDNEFKKAEQGESIEIDPFESVITIGGITDESLLRSSFAIDQTTGLILPGAVDDEVIAIKYYTLQGVEVPTDAVKAANAINGLILKKQTLKSGKVITTKEIINKK